MYLSNYYYVIDKLNQLRCNDVLCNMHVFSIDVYILHVEVNIISDYIEYYRGVMSVS